MIRKYSELYHLAMEIKDIEPWVYIHYTDKILLEDAGELVFYSFFEFSHAMGIAIYEGTESINNFFNVFTVVTTKEEQQHTLARQQFSMCVYVKKHELHEFDLKIYDLMKLDLVEDELYPSFYFKKTAHPPQAINEEKVGEVGKYLYHLKQILNALNNEEIYCNFENEEFIIRKYLPDKSEWKNIVSMNLVLPEQRIEPFNLSQNLIDKLRERRKVDRELMLDYRYLEFPVHDNEIEIPYYPAVSALFDYQTNEIISSKITNPNQDYLFQCLRVLTSFIHARGIPKMLYIIQEDVFHYINPLLTALDIKVLVTYDFSMTNYLFNFLSEEIKIPISDDDEVIVM